VSTPRTSTTSSIPMRPSPSPEGSSTGIDGRHAKRGVRPFTATARKAARASQLDLQQNDLQDAWDRIGALTWSIRRTRVRWKQIQHQCTPWGGERDGSAAAVDSMRCRGGCRCNRAYSGCGHEGTDHKRSTGSLHVNPPSCHWNIAKSPRGCHPRLRRAAANGRTPHATSSVRRPSIRV
jgi:hypothetical protein